MKPAEQLDQILQATQMILDSGSKEVLSLSDLTDVFVNRVFVEHSKQMGLISLPLTKKAAVVGVTGLKTILLKASNAFTPKPPRTF